MTVLPAPLLADLARLAAIVPPAQLGRDNLVPQLRQRSAALRIASGHYRLELLMIAALCLAAVDANDAATLPTAGAAAGQGSRA